MGSPTRTLSDADTSRWREGLAAAAAGWLAARIAVALGFLLAHGLSGRLDMPDGRLHLQEGLMTWDGTFYRVIAEGWYGGAGTPGEAVRFFPAYPGLARLLSPLTLGNEDVALLLIANSCALAAAVVLWRLAVEVTGDPAVARRAAWMVAVIPAANVFAFAYTEAPMLLVSTAFLLALHRRAPWWAAALGLVAGLLRPSGVLLLVPALVVAWQWWAGGRRSAGDPAGTEQSGEGASRRTPGAVAGWAAAALAPVAGLLAALVWVSGPDGDVAEAYRIQRRLRDGFRDPLTRIGEAFVDFAQGAHHDVYNVAFALGFAALFVVAVRRRQPAAWIAFMAVTWVVAVGANNMDSAGRYCVVAAPFTVALAQWAGTRAREAAVAAVGLAGTVWFTSEVLLGRIIP